MPDRRHRIAYRPLELLPVACLAEPSRPPRRRLGGRSAGAISELPDLTQVTEATRRALYDLVVRDHFSPTAEQIEDARRDPGNHWVPTYTADEAGLQVVWAFGRWFAVWARARLRARVARGAALGGQCPGARPRDREDRLPRSLRGGGRAVRRSGNAARGRALRP